jgi:ATP-dependent exoDNAse (exonuclease V) beta subunit|tara:strand:- start:530 stop:1222 length:693 start_codon:yes stop_codon:yes gene_type:complete
VKLVHKYEYPTSTRAAIDGLRHYNIDGSSDKLPSVTTVLGQTQTSDKAASLQRWRDKVGNETARKITQEAAARGTSMHLYLEKYCLGEGYLDMTDVGNVAKHMAEKIVDKGIDNRLTEIYGNEAVLYYPGLYAGSCDLIGELDGQITIIDFKQTNKPKQREWIGDYFLQMAAYGMAHDAVYDTAIEKGVILMCSKDLYYQEFVIEGKEYRSAKHGFLRRLDQFYSDKGKV